MGSNENICTVETSTKYTGTIIITGGTKGIGLATAKEMVRLGYRNFILGYHRSDEAASSAKTTLEQTDGVTAVLVKGDVALESTTAYMLSTLEKEFGGSLYAIAHTAGLYLPDGPNPETNFDKYQDIYPTAFWRLVERGVPYMEGAGRGGRIVSLSSPGCNLLSSPRDGYFLPGCGKASMEYLSRLFAQRLASKHITCNIVIPGITDTEGWPPKLAEKLALKRCPMKKIIPPSEVGAAVAFLLSDRAGFITGAVLPVDGGLMFV